ncbi:hypothetical protein [uncultured Sphingomonas sp.]|uniref:hypothetical protein n=1 Tax=uncultured Sphingomonas sp. TaxID=158754 RepID=UPI0035CADB72
MMIDSVAGLSGQIVRDNTPFPFDSKVWQGGGKAVDPARPFGVFGLGSARSDLARINAIHQPSFTETQAFSAFGQLGFDITDRLNLTVGLRPNQDGISGTAGVAIRNLAGVIIPTTPTVYRRGVFNATTDNPIVSYDVAQDVIAHGSYARGNSPGGLNRPRVRRRCGRRPVAQLSGGGAIHLRQVEDRRSRPTTCRRRPRRRSTSLVSRWCGRPSTRSTPP